MVKAAARCTTGGVHSAARSELQAIVHAAAICSGFEAGAEASYVVNGSEEIELFAQITAPNGDLWKMLLRAEQLGRRWKVSKVKGHVNESLLQQHGSSQRSWQQRSGRGC